MTTTSAVSSARTAKRSAETKQPYLVIWNPDAGGGEGDTQARRAEIERAMAANGLDVELFESPSESAAQARLEAARGGGYGAIVAAGGDGTVRSVGFALVDSDMPLGILPMGTAMNVARSLDIPLDLEGAAQVLAKGSVRSIDVGEARGRQFLEIASIGLTAEVLARATEASEGRLHAVVDGLRQAIRYRRTRVRLQLDGREVRGRALALAVANGAFTGRGMELAPTARLDDGKFDVLLFEGYGGLSLAAHLVRLLLGHRGTSRLRRYRAERVWVSTRRPLPVRLDSQDLGSTPIELVTRAGALKVIAPG